MKINDKFQLNLVEDSEKKNRDSHILLSSGLRFIVSCQSVVYQFFRWYGNISLAGMQTISLMPHLQDTRRLVFDIQSCRNGLLRQLMKSNVIGISLDDDDEILISTSPAVACGVKVKQLVWKALQRKRTKTAVERKRPCDQGFQRRLC